MIPAAVFLIVLVLFALEALVLWLAQLGKLRVERDHWDRLHPVELYDWQNEVDL